MERYEIAEAAGRAGLDVDELGQLVELGIVSPGGDARFTRGDVRRMGMVHNLVAAGVPLEGLIEAQVKAGFRSAVVQQLMRSQGESLRRIAERYMARTRHLNYARFARPSTLGLERSRGQHFPSRVSRLRGPSPAPVPLSIWTIWAARACSPGRDQAQTGR